VSLWGTRGPESDGAKKMTGRDSLGRGKRAGALAGKEGLARHRGALGLRCQCKVAVRGKYQLMCPWVRHQVGERSRRK